MKKIVLLSIGVVAFILQNASAQSLFTTSNDFSGFTSDANFTIAPVATSLDSSSINGIGNTSAPGAAGTSGSLQITRVNANTTFDNSILSQGEQGNAAFLSALETASTLTYQYTTPTTSGGTFFGVGIVLNYTGHFVQQGADSTTTVGGITTATINWAADGLGAAIAAQAAGGGINFFQFGVLYNSNFTPTSSFAVDNFQAVQPVPEPGTMALVGLGALGLLKFARRRS
jgi:PEP-CTERM motif